MYLCTDFTVFLTIMDQSAKHILQLKTMPQGKHSFAFELDDIYFEQVESNLITGGDVAVNGTIERVGSVFTIDMTFDGEVDTTCDRCLGVLTLPVETEARLVVKFGETYNDESDEIIIVPEREGVVDLTWPLYEFVVLSLPMQRMHDEDACDPEMISVMTRYQVPEAAEKPTDPRWAALTKIKNEKD